MTLFAATHSEAGTFHSLAAACTSMMRAAAPPLRTYSCEVRMPRLPPVEKSPHGRLRFTLSPGVGYSVTTLDQLHSSSSATIDRKSTRLNSSHLGISYAVFCLKKNKVTRTQLCP